MDSNSTSNLPDSNPSKKLRVIIINKRKFVVGLAWRGLDSPRNYMKQAKQIGKKDGLDVVAIRLGQGIQAGFAPKKSAALKGMYSLAVCLASILEGDWIGAFPLVQEAGDKEQLYVVIASGDGGKIVPWTDKVMNKEETESSIADLKSHMINPESGNTLKVYGAPEIKWVTDVAELEALLVPSSLKRTYKLKPLTLGLTKKQIYTYSTAAVVAMIGLYLYSSYQDKKALEEAIRINALIEAQKELNRKAKYETQLKNLIHPWVKQASIKEYVASCDLQNKNADISLGGWLSESVVCKQEGTTYWYSRIPETLASVESFKAAVQKKFGNDVVISFEEKSFSTGYFSLPNSMQGNGDDPMLPITDQTTKVVSLLQKNNIDINLSPKEIIKESKDADGDLIPAQDWSETDFSFVALIPPRVIFHNSNLEGVRINKIQYIPNYEDGSLKYVVEGAIYGSH